MSVYEIEQYELWTQKHRVEADNEAAAIVKLFAGDAMPVEDSSEYMQVHEELGLPVKDHAGLCDALKERGVALPHGVIPSIREICLLP